MIANCTKCCGLHSGFAPASSSRNSLRGVGRTTAMAGRSTVSRVPSLSFDAAINPPVLPHDMTTSPFLSVTRSIARAMEQPFFLRRTSMGLSSMVSTSSVCTILMRLSQRRAWAMAARICASSPTRCSSEILSYAWRAIFTPSMTTSQPWSPPMTSTTIRINKRAQRAQLPIRALRASLRRSPQPSRPGGLCRIHRRDRPGVERRGRHTAGRWSIAAVSERCYRPGACVDDCEMVYAWERP